MRVQNFGTFRDLPGGSFGSVNATIFPPEHHQSMNYHPRVVERNEPLPDRYSWHHAFLPLKAQQQSASERRPTTQQRSRTPPLNIAKDVYCIQAPSSARSRLVAGRQVPRKLVSAVYHNPHEVVNSGRNINKQQVGINN